MENIKETQKPNRFEEAQRIYEEKGLSTNIEALIGIKDKCKHERAIPTRFELVSENYEISEVVCTKCGQTIEILGRRVLKHLSFFKLPQLEDKNEKEG